MYGIWLTLFQTHGLQASCGSVVAKEPHVVCEPQVAKEEEFYVFKKRKNPTNCELYPTFTSSKISFNDVESNIQTSILYSIYSNQLSACDNNTD